MPDRKSFYESLSTNRIIDSQEIDFDTFERAMSTPDFSRLVYDHSSQRGLVNAEDTSYDSFLKGWDVPSMANEGRAREMSNAVNEWSSSQGENVDEFGWFKNMYRAGTTGWASFLRGKVANEYMSVQQHVERLYKEADMRDEGDVWGMIKSTFSHAFFGDDSGLSAVPTDVKFGDGPRSIVASTDELRERADRLEQWAAEFFQPKIQQYNMAISSTPYKSYMAEVSQESLTSARGWMDIANAMVEGTVSSAPVMLEIMGHTMSATNVAKGIVYGSKAMFTKNAEVIKQGSALIDRSVTMARPVLERALLSTGIARNQAVAASMVPKIVSGAYINMGGSITGTAAMASSYASGVFGDLIYEGVDAEIAVAEADRVYGDVWNQVWLNALGVGNLRSLSGGAATRLGTVANIVRQGADEIWQEGVADAGRRRGISQMYVGEEFDKSGWEWVMDPEWLKSDQAFQSFIGGVGMGLGMTGVSYVGGNVSRAIFSDESNLEVPTNNVVTAARTKINQALSLHESALREVEVRLQDTSLPDGERARLQAERDNRIEKIDGLNAGKDLMHKVPSVGDTIVYDSGDGQSVQGVVSQVDADGRIIIDTESGTMKITRDADRIAVIDAPDLSQQKVADGETVSIRVGKGSFHGNVISTNENGTLTVQYINSNGEVRTVNRSPSGVIHIDPTPVDIVDAFVDNENAISSNDYLNAEPVPVEAKAVANELLIEYHGGNVSAKKVGQTEDGTALYAFDEGSPLYSSLGKQELTEAQIREKLADPRTTEPDIDAPAEVVADAPAEVVAEAPAEVVADAPIKPKVKLHERPHFQNPVYTVDTPEGPRYLQKVDNMLGATAGWVEVVKKKGSWENASPSRSPGMPEFAIGWNRNEAVEHLINNPRPEAVGKKKGKGKGKASFQIADSDSEQGSNLTSTGEAQGLTLVHYSSKVGLKELDPSKEGTGRPGQAARGGVAPGVPATYFYMDGTRGEGMVVRPAQAKYTVDGTGMNIYDLGKDSVNQAFAKQVKEENNGVLDRDKLLQKIKDAGFDGYMNSGYAGMDNVVGLFNKTNPTAEYEVTSGERRTMQVPRFGADGELMAQRLPEALVVNRTELPKKSAADVGIALDRLTPRGQVLDQHSDPALRKARADLHGLREVAAMLGSRDARGALIDWYTTSVEEAIAKVKEVFPEIKTKTDESMFLLFTALTSSGQNPMTNMVSAFKMWQHSNYKDLSFTTNWGEERKSFYKKDGKQIATGRVISENANSFIVEELDGWARPVIVKKTGEAKRTKINKKDLKEGSPQPTSFLQRPKPLDTSMENLSQLVAELGDIETVLEWLKTEQPVSELRKYKLVPDEDGKKGQYPTGSRPGAYIFGEKLGSFFLNLEGAGNNLTMDLWFSRTWNRYMGTIMSDKGEIIGGPRNDAEREVMRDWVEGMGSSLGIAPSMVQAVLWGFEQQLWTMAGKDSPSYDYVHGAEYATESAFGADSVENKKVLGVNLDRSSGEQAKASALNVIAERFPEHDSRRIVAEAVALGKVSDVMTVSVAPQRSKDSATSTEFEKAQIKKSQVEFIDHMVNLADGLGLFVDGIQPVLGGYLMNDGTKISELSYSVSIYGDPEIIAEFAAIMAAAAPDVQESVIVSKVSAEGKDEALVVNIKKPSLGKKKGAARKKAEDAHFNKVSQVLREFFGDGFSYNPKTSKVTIFTSGKEGKQKVKEAYGSPQGKEILPASGGSVINVDSKKIEESEYGDYVRRGRARLAQRDGQVSGDVDNIIRKAEEALGINDKAQMQVDGRGAAANKTLSKEGVRQIADDFTQSHAVEVEVVDSESQLPAHLQQQIKENKLEGRIPGLYDPVTDTVYIIGGEGRTAAEVVQTLLHETVHYALRRMSQSERSSLLDQVYQSALDAGLGADIKSIAATYAADVTTASGRRKVAEELVAKTGEFYGKRNTRPIADKVISGLRKFFGAFTKRYGVTLTDREIIELSDALITSTQAERGFIPSADRHAVAATKIMAKIDRNSKLKPSYYHEGQIEPTYQQGTPEYYRSLEALAKDNALTMREELALAHMYAETRNEDAKELFRVRTGVPLDDALTKIYSDVFLEAQTEGTPLFSDAIMFQINPNPAVDTPNFKNWFGDSKVVDSYGRPKMVFSGHKLAGRDEFGSQLGEYTDYGTTWFTDNTDVAKTYSGVDSSVNFSPSRVDGSTIRPGIYNAYVKLENPLVVEGKGAFFTNINLDGKEMDTRAIAREAYSKGHDGFIIKDIVAPGPLTTAKINPSTVYGVFDSSSIKSAHYNNGNFDPDNKSIRMQINETPPTESVVKEIKKMTDAVGLVLRTGRGGPKGSRAVAKQPNVVRTNNVSDFKGIARATGDAIQSLYGETTDRNSGLHKDYLTYAEGIIEPGRLNKMSAKEVMNRFFGEAFADYMTNRAFLQSNYPEMAYEISERLKSLGISDTINEVHSAAERYWSVAPQERTKVGVVTSKPKTMVEKMRKMSPDATIFGGIRQLASHTYMKFIGGMEPINMAARELRNRMIAQRGGERFDLLPSEDPNKLARLTADSFSRGQVDIDHGVAPYMGTQSEGPSLSDGLRTALGEGWDDAKINSFGTYLAGVRMVEEWKRFHNGEIKNPPSKESYADWIATVTVLEAENSSYAEGAEMVREWTNNLWRKAFESGQITKEMYDVGNSRSHYYIPLNRVMDDKAGRGPASGKADSKLVKQFKGSGRDIVNPIESLIKMSYGLNSRIAMNDAVLSFANMLRGVKKSGDIAEIVPSKKMQKIELSVKDALLAIENKLEDEAASVLESFIDILDEPGVFSTDDTSIAIYRSMDVVPAGKRMVFWYEDGKKQAMLLSEDHYGADLFESFQQLDAANRENLSAVIRAIATPASVLRAGITTEPTFFFANMIRDQLAAWAVTDVGYVPFADWFSGVASELTQDEAYQMYRRASGLNSVVLEAAKKDNYNKSIKRLEGKNIFLRNLNLKEGGLRALAELTSLSESGTRIGLFKKAYTDAVKRGLTDIDAATEAAYITRDYIDFSRSGSSRSMHAFRKTVTFANVGIQSLDKLVRTLTAEGEFARMARDVVAGNEVAQTPAEKKKVNQALNTLSKMMAMSMLGLVQAMAYQGDEEYEEINQEWIRHTHWVTKLPGTKYWATIPKPFELSVMSNIMESAYESAAEQDPRWAKNVYDSVMGAIGVPYIPTGPKVLVEARLNRSLDTGRDIVPMNLASREVEDQWNEYTSTVAKSLGESIGISPIKIDHVIRGFTGSWGRTATDFTNEADPNAPANGWSEQYFVRRFVKNPYKNSNSRNEIFDLIANTGATADAQYNSFRSRIVDVSHEEAAKYFSGLPRFAQIYVAHRSDAATSTGRSRPSAHPLDGAWSTTRMVSEFNKYIRESEDVHPEIKRDVLDLVTMYVAQQSRNALVASGHPSYSATDFVDYAGSLGELQSNHTEIFGILAGIANEKRIPLYNLSSLQAFKEVVDEGSYDNFIGRIQRGEMLFEF